MGCAPSAVPGDPAPGALHSSEPCRRLAQPARIRAGETTIRVLLSAAFLGPLAETPDAAGYDRRAAAGAHGRLLPAGRPAADDRTAAVAAEASGADGSAAAAARGENQPS